MSRNRESHAVHHPRRGIIVTAGVILLVAGAASPASNARESPRDTPAPGSPAASTVHVYPSNGQSDEQSDRDRYECHLWAVQQTGFDPSNPQVPPHRRMRVIAGGPPPGAQVGAGAVTGAVVGAAVSSPWQTGRGALLGAIAGAAIGGVAASERTAEVNRMQAQDQSSAYQVQTARLERQATDFRRALSACLEARGYSVK